jgi:hypothetical protein
MGAEVLQEPARSTAAAAGAIPGHTAVEARRVAAVVDTVAVEEDVEVDGDEPGFSLEQI